MAVEQRDGETGCTPNTRAFEYIYFQFVNDARGPRKVKHVYRLWRTWQRTCRNDGPIILPHVRRT